MIKGRVIGKIWSSRRVDTMPSGALLEVETSGGGCLIAFDPLGCNTGEARIDYTRIGRSRVLFWKSLRLLTH